MTNFLEKARQAFNDGTLDQAAQYTRYFLAQNPDDPQGVHLLATIALIQKKPATTIALIGRILPSLSDRDPILAGRLYQTLGRALLMETHYEAARSAFVLSVTYFPEEAAAHAGLGEVFLQMGKYEEAANALSRAVRLASKEPVIWGLLGEAYAQAQQYEQAASAYKQAIKFCPSETSFYANLGAVLFHLSQWEDAKINLEKAVLLGNEKYETFLSLALTLLSLGKILEAQNIFENLLKKHPENLHIRLNIGSFYYEIGERHKAEEIFLSIEQKAPDSELALQASFNRSAILLEKGLWQEGWDCYEKRHFFTQSKVKSSLPLWDGAEGEGAVALSLEGGLGDSLTFLRFLPLAAKKRRLKLECPAEFQTLLSFMPNLDLKNLASPKDKIVARQSLNSLPYVLHINEAPSSEPYFNIPGEKETDLIGLSWSGNPQYAFDKRRSLSLELLEPLKDIPHIRFLNLQREGECPTWMEKPPLHNITDLARAVKRCALIISIDSLVANMAGAIGTPLWLLHRRGGDWRWKHHFWYQNVTLYESSSDETSDQTRWFVAIEKIKEALWAWSRQGDRH
ncbi:tetratricopeptide repeat protein [Aristophania vespae]|uniref:Tetratricopeptide repeat protein n=1 Tax=Aristophania vespae TaxID=2697033 RepID=A0A6P1N9V8_9PROT|nr:tetratricopeptide repeat protein [Aristophania vespae]QHI95375.1 tetratricopeptide repeat protein [Aristophania vespae]